MCDDVVDAFTYASRCLNLDILISTEYHIAHRSSRTNVRFGMLVNNVRWNLHDEFASIKEDLKTLSIKLHFLSHDQIPCRVLFTEADIVAVTLLTISNPLIRILRARYRDLQFESKVEETICITHGARTIKRRIDSHQCPQSLA